MRNPLGGHHSGGTGAASMSLVSREQAPHHPSVAATVPNHPHESLAVANTPTGHDALGYSTDNLGCPTSSESTEHTHPLIPPDIPSLLSTVATPLDLGTTTYTAMIPGDRAVRLSTVSSHVPTPPDLPLDPTPLLSSDVALSPPGDTEKQIFKQNYNKLNNYYGGEFIKGERIQRIDEDRIATPAGFAGNGARELLASYMTIPGFAEVLKRLIPNTHQALTTLRDNQNYLLAYLKDHYEGTREIAEEEPRNPYELVRNTGYHLTGPFTSVDEFMGYANDFRPHELICTYTNPENRLSNYHILWLRHEEADSIVPADQLTKATLTEPWKQYLRTIPNRYDPTTDTYILEGIRPSRQDPYGTSSMSVQISRKGVHVSIKNRYNHTVTNPDNTYDNNLDHIVYGLRRAIYHIVGRDDLMSIGAQSLADNYIHDNTGGIHRYYIEKENIYLGYYEYVCNGRVTKIDPTMYVMLSPELYVSRTDDTVITPVTTTTDLRTISTADNQRTVGIYANNNLTKQYTYTLDNRGKVQALALTVAEGAETENISRNPQLTTLTIAEGAKTGRISHNPQLTTLTIAKGASTWSIYENPQLTTLTIAKGAETENISRNPQLTTLTIAEGAKTGRISHNPQLTTLTIAEGAVTGGIFSNHPDIVIKNL